MRAFGEIVTLTHVSYNLKAFSEDTPLPSPLICSECNATMLIHQYDESAVGLEGSWEGREVPELINSNFS